MDGCGSTSTSTSTPTPPPTYRTNAAYSLIEALTRTTNKHPYPYNTATSPVSAIVPHGHLALRGAHTAPQQPPSATAAAAAVPRYTVG
ncbi:hypothetical protein V493_07830 [Pseudogymnoascus sp. VKM F-4281 (FW-2241)]|nr:hypothetical protein V493_07830 [Pseudogymnoascus sp. VKM F-4281 (FW-2241)]